MFLNHDLSQPTARVLTLASGMAVAGHRALMNGAPPGVPVD